MVTKLRPVAAQGSSRSSLLSDAFVVLLLLLFSGCSSITKTPFALDAESIDVSSPQTPARIRLSPPQVFTREQLINDRLREDGFLKDQLANSATAPLGTSLARDLQTISALSAQLSISVDPAAKLNFQKQTQVANLQQQIDVVQLQGQLLTLKNQLQALQKGTGAGPAAPTSSPATSVTSGTSTTASDTQITNLQSRVDSALTALSSLGATTRQNAVSGTLEDEFEDRLALRARIREAINANALDDSHDINGNALYHLQFTATLLPPPRKGEKNEGIAQFGIARIKVKPPVLKVEDIDLLYNTWLAQVTNRMNQSTDNRTNVKPAMRYEILGPMTGLYDVASFRIKREDGTDTGNRVLLAVRPGDRYLFDNLNNNDYINKLIALNAFAKNLKELEDNQSGKCLNEIHDYFNKKGLAIEPDAKKTILEFIPDCKIPTTLYDNLKNLTQGCSDELIGEFQNKIRVEPSIEAIVFALGDRSLLPEDYKHEIAKADAIYSNVISNAKWVLNELGYKYDLPPVPPQFCKVLLVDANDNPLECKKDMTWPQHAAGLAFPYSVDPVLRSQRVSTVASAANALELAAAASAQVPQSGAGVGAGLGYSRRAAGRADTIERVPQVFGFAGPIAGQAEPYEFGWVFGPKLSLDASGNKMLLRQEARTQQVSVDLSVPAWWPGAILDVQTAWKGKFSGTGSILNKADDKDSNPDPYFLPIRFNSLNPPALDALTDSLAPALMKQGFRQARIDMVRPNVIPICADATNKSVTILIYGINLWHNPQVYIGGQPVPSSGITVLPDMTGIAATIDTSLISKAAIDNDPTLVVWTAHGVADSILNTKISASCENTAGETASKTPNESSSILAVSPNQISMCDSTVDISVMGTNLAKKAEEYYLGTIRAKSIVDDSAEFAQDSTKLPKKGDARVQAVTVTFENPLKDNNKGLTSLALTMIRPDGLASATIDVGGTDCKSTKSSSFTFTSATRTLPPGCDKDHSGMLRVFMTFPAFTTGQKSSSIVISATNGGNIRNAAFPDEEHPGVSLKIASGTVTVTMSKPPIEGAKPTIAVDLSLTGLVEGGTLSLTAIANAESESKIDLPVSISKLAKPEVDNVKSSAVPQPFTFTSAITAITSASDKTATMRVLLSFPSGKTSSIAISSKGGELMNAAFTDSTPPVNVSLKSASGTVTVTTTAIPSKDAKPFGIDLTFRDLVMGQTLTLTATAKPPTTQKPDPIKISIVPVPDHWVRPLCPRNPR